MKRSEMIELMDQAFDGWLDKTGLYPESVDKTTWDYMLKAMEKAGILPPEVKPLPQDVIDNCLPGNYWEEE